MPHPPPGLAEITVVIPAYNVSTHIKACLRSLLDQSYADWTCVVVDDGSTDDTAARVLGVTDPRINLLRRDNGGVSQARNQGLAEVKGPFVMFLDGDDLLHPTALERLREALAESPETVASFGPLRKVLANGDPYPGEKRLADVRYPDGNVLEHMVRENFLANGGQVLVRSAPARRIGGFDPALRLSEDWEFWCRLALCGPFRYIGNAADVFSLRVSEGGASGTLAAEWANHRPALDKVLDNGDIAACFSPHRWQRLCRQARASHLFEAGRVNFTCRDFPRARRLMLEALWADPRPKRIALFALAQLSQLLGRSLASRLRFRDEDRRPTAGSSS